MVRPARQVRSARPTNLRLDDQLCFALYAASNTVVRAYRPLLAQMGLTYPQYLVMLVLWQDGEQAVHEIAARLALPAHAVSPVLERLDDAGFVIRRRAEPDHRVVHVSLTAAGAELQGAASRAQRSVARGTGLAPGALDGLRDDLHELVRHMDPGRSAQVLRRRPRKHTRSKSHASASSAAVKSHPTTREGAAS